MVALSRQRRIAAYGRMADSLLDYLRSVRDEQGRFPERPTYGYAMTAWFGQLAPEPDGELSRCALAAHATIDPEGYDYPWEFVTFALASLDRASPGFVPAELLEGHRTRGTRVTNWRLLRVVNRAMRRGPSLPVWLAARAIRRVFTSREGLICDALGTRSLQYHAFSALLVARLHALCGWPFLLEWLKGAALFSRRQTMADGTALYLGRGQEQIFGYGSLLYVYEYVDRLWPELGLGEVTDRVLRRLASFQRADGSFPLMLRRREPEPPNVTTAEQPAGWFGYNTLYDYLPFLGVCLGLLAREGWQ